MFSLNYLLLQLVYLITFCYLFQNNPCLLRKTCQCNEQLFKDKKFIDILKNAQITPCNKNDNNVNKEN